MTQVLPHFFSKYLPFLFAPFRLFLIFFVVIYSDLAIDWLDLVHIGFWKLFFVLLTITQLRGFRVWFLSSGPFLPFREKWFLNLVHGVIQEVLVLIRIMLLIPIDLVHNSAELMFFQTLFGTLAIFRNCAVVVIFLQLIFVIFLLLFFRKGATRTILYLLFLWFTVRLDLTFVQQVLLCNRGRYRGTLHCFKSFSSLLSYKLFDLFRIEHMS